MSKPALFLASSSPRRRELLRQIGLDFTLVSAQVDETPRHDETPHDYVSRLAQDKAAAGMCGIPPGWGLVIAADTSVVLDDRILGKPASENEAVAMWEQLSGRSHEVLTGLAIGHHDRLEHCVVSTRVHFRRLSRVEMLAYWASGEPRDKAGGYGIQGLGALWVSGIEGSYSNVVGLPLAETGELLTRFDYPLWGDVAS